jgi:hypothetical protein
VFVKKRIAAILALATTMVIGISAPAAGAGDPVFVSTRAATILCTVNPVACPKWPIALFSANAVFGPSLGDAVCTPENQTAIPAGAVDIWVCKQQD